MSKERRSKTRVVSLTERVSPTAPREREARRTGIPNTHIEEDTKEWNCNPIIIPLEKVIRGFCIFDVIRGIVDTLAVIINIYLIHDLTYTDLRESLNIAIPSWDSQTEPVSPEELNKAEISFDNNKKGLTVALSFAIPVCFAEVPLAIYLFRNVLNRQRLLLVRYLQISLAIIFFNMIVAILIMIYTTKVGINQDAIMMHGIPLSSAVQILIFRITVFDMSKGAELVVVHIFMNDNTRRRVIFFDGE